jgi:two-component system sensor histidine kinase KdpD
MSEIVGGEVAVFLRAKSPTPQLAFGHETSIARNNVSVAVAAWVIEHDQVAGANTDTLPNAGAVFFPLIGSQQTLGAIALKNDSMASLLDPEQRRMIEACANQLALALERDQMAIDAAESRIQAESEQLRSTMLSSVSHDLKTPLAAIAGATSSLLESPTLGDETRRQLLETVADEASRLNRLLENILQMSRIDAGAVRPNRQWHVLEEIIGSSLHRTSGQLANRPISIALPADLPLISVDGLLLEQVFVNLLENAARYTPAGTPVHIAASVVGETMRISIADEGPGIPAGSEHRIFEKFYRGSTPPDGGRGSGLGLAICRAIMQVHGGTITATNRSRGGAEFVLTLPLLKEAPRVVVE